MEVTVEQRAPVVRCYECGSSYVSALCHHCWRPGCVKHVLPSPLWAEKLFGGEGGGPGLQNTGPAIAATAPMSEPEPPGPQAAGSR